MSGDLTLPSKWGCDKEGVDLDWIKISSHMKLPTEDYSLRKLIRTIYPDHQHHSGDAMYLKQCSIMAPKTIDVDEVNNVILELLSKELHTYLNANSFILTEERCKCYYMSFNGFIVSGGIFEHFAIQWYHKS